MSIFDVIISLPGKKKITLKNINIPLLGLHNIRNATAAVAVAFTIGISTEIIKNSLIKFQGVQRRFNKIFNYRGVSFFDDYAHHPTEISSILNGVRKVYSNRKIIAVFEPHRYSRVNSLKKAFSKCFSKSDLVLICPIYAAGEKRNKSFNLESFAKLISDNSDTQVILIDTQKQLLNFFKKNLIKDEVIIGMGAGLISKWMRELKTGL